MTEDTKIPETEPIEAAIDTSWIVKQHALSAEAPTEVKLPQGTLPLDVHMIDGAFYLRVLEPAEGGEAFIVTLVPAGLGTKFAVPDDATIEAVAVRHGGIHFFVVR